MSSLVLDKTQVISLPDVAVVNRAYTTFEEYLEQSSDTRQCEWVDGEIITVAGASFEHQDLSKFLVTILNLLLHIKIWA